jgi:predicted metalloprotease with PDZ domain
MGWLENRESGTRLTGLERGGYRLVYRDTPNDYALLDDASAGVINLRFSLGMALSPSGGVQEVLWDSPAFKAGLTAGAQVLAVSGRAFSEDEIKQAIVNAQDSGLTELLVKRGKHHQLLTIEYSGGHRFPHLEPTGARARLDEIHTPKTRG